MTSVVCIKCRCAPCACQWLKKLVADPGKAELLRTARLMVKSPLPAVDGETTYHFPACPCPKCWSLRAASWSRSGPYPTPPERESWPQLHQPDQEDAS